MSCESDEADLALLPGQIGRLDSAVAREDHLRVFLVHDFVELPQIDHIGPQAAQAVLQMFHGGLFVAAVVLCHEEDLLSITVCKGLAHELFGPAVVVFPGVVQERNAHIDGLSDQPDRLAVVSDSADVASSQPKHGDLQACAAQGTRGNIRLAGSGRMLSRDHSPPPPTASVNWPL